MIDTNLRLMLLPANLIVTRVNLKVKSAWIERGLLKERKGSMSTVFRVLRNTEYLNVISTCSRQTRQLLTIGTAKVGSSGLILIGIRLPDRIMRTHDRVDRTGISGVIKDIENMLAAA